MKLKFNNGIRKINKTSFSHHDTRCGKYKRQFYEGVYVDIDNYRFDDINKEWFDYIEDKKNRCVNGVGCTSGMEYGINSIRAFRRYLRKNKHGIPKGTEVILLSSIIGMDVVGQIN